MSTPAFASYSVVRQPPKEIQAGKFLSADLLQQDQGDALTQEAGNLAMLRLLYKLFLRTASETAAGQRHRFLLGALENPRVIGPGERTLLHDYEQTVARLRWPEAEEAEISDRDRLKIEFHSLVSQWERETSFQSSLGVRFTHPAYVRIIGMGRDALPLVFSELSRKPGHWFYALTNIVGKDVAAESGAKTFAQASDAWLRWGKDHNYI
ncbi:MAG: hypothetical protein ABSD58_02410 [Verrucomicrobiia bacterium]|jgi:hypothetical protein